MTQERGPGPRLPSSGPTLQWQQGPCGSAPHILYSPLPVASSSSPAPRGSPPTGGTRALLTHSATTILHCRETGGAQACARPGAAKARLARKSRLVLLICLRKLYRRQCGWQQLPWSPRTRGKPVVPAQTVGHWLGARFAYTIPPQCRGKNQGCIAPIPPRRRPPKEAQASPQAQSCLARRVTGEAVLRKTDRNAGLFSAPLPRPDRHTQHGRCTS